MKKKGYIYFVTNKSNKDIISIHAGVRNDGTG